MLRENDCYLFLLYNKKNLFLLYSLIFDQGVKYKLKTNFKKFQNIGKGEARMKGYL